MGSYCAFGVDRDFVGTAVESQVKVRENGRRAGRLCGPFDEGFSELSYGKESKIVEE